MSSSTCLTVLSLLALAASLSDASSVMAPRRPRGPATAAQFLSAINAARAEVGVPPLSWNATVAQGAKAYANWLRTSAGCDLAQINRSPIHHDGPLTFFLGPGWPSPAEAVWGWVDDERRWYDYGANSCAPGKQCGDYTLVVTRAWRQLGCAVVACASGGALMVCEYHPAPGAVLPNPEDPPY